jgi:hypothetical protein
MGWQRENEGRRSRRRETPQDTPRLRRFLIAAVPIRVPCAPPVGPPPEKYEDQRQQSRYPTYINSILEVRLHVSDDLLAYLPEDRVQHVRKQVFSRFRRVCAVERITPEVKWVQCGRPFSRLVALDDERGEDRDYRCEHDQSDREREHDALSSTEDRHSGQAEKRIYP